MPFSLLGKSDVFVPLNHVPHYQLITRPEQLAPLYAALDRCTEIALDTEADNLFRYKTRVCLLQIHVVDEIHLVDLLADLPLNDLWPRLAAKPLIMHGSDDRVIPFQFGERLFAMAHEPKQFVRLSGGGHEDLDDFGAIEIARRFIGTGSPSN